MKGQIALSHGRWIASRKLDCSADKAWLLITDTTLWSTWGPSVTSVACRDTFITADSHGQVVTALGLRLPFDITRYDKGKFWSWRVGKFKATGHRVIPLTDYTCRLEFDMPWWAAAYIPVCLVALDRIVSLSE